MKVFLYIELMFDLYWGDTFTLKLSWQSQLFHFVDARLTSLCSD